MTSPTHITGRTSVICTPRFPICLSFNSQQSLWLKYTSSSNVLTWKELNLFGDPQLTSSSIAHAIFVRERLIYWLLCRKLSLWRIYTLGWLTSSDPPRLSQHQSHEAQKGESFLTKGCEKWNVSWETPFNRKLIVFSSIVSMVDSIL
jgi:hypothetical protein